MDAFKQEVSDISSLSFKFTAILFGANYFYNASLGMTSVSSSTVLSNTSSIFVYILGLLMLPGGKFDMFKALMVLLSFSGIVVITIADDSGGDDGAKNSNLGNIFCLIAAFFYSL